MFYFHEFDDDEYVEVPFIVKLIVVFISVFGFMCLLGSLAP